MKTNKRVKHRFADNHGDAIDVYKFGDRVFLKVGVGRILGRYLPLNKCASWQIS